METDLWIARNQNGSLVLFNTKPTCVNGTFVGGESLTMNPADESWLTFEDSPKPLYPIDVQWCDGNCEDCSRVWNCEHAD